MIAPAAPALSVQATPGPSVEVYFATLHVDADTITVFRTADGITEAVAGAERASVSGDFVVVDTQVPFGVVSSYVGRIFDASGASLDGPPATITVESDDVWFQSQLDPTTAVAVELMEQTFSSVSRKRRTERVYVAGLARPFEQNWGMGGIEGLPFNVLSRGDNAAIGLQFLLGYSPLLIRTPPRLTTLPRALSASITNPIHEPLDWAQANTENAIVWTLTVDEVQPTSKAVVRPLITWDDWTTAFPSGTYTWADVMAVYGAGTWTDAIRNPPNA